jgi:hypothetical protein
MPSFFLISKLSSFYQVEREKSYNSGLIGDGDILHVLSLYRSVLVESYSTLSLIIAMLCDNFWAD